MSLRQEKVSELIKRYAAVFFESETDGSSLITITDCQASESLKHVRILISVFPTKKEEATLEFLKSKTMDFRNYLKTKLKMKFIPQVDVEIDKGEKNRQRIEELLKQ